MERFKGIALAQVRRQCEAMPETPYTCSPNALDPNRMTAAEWIAEIGEILAASIVRLRSKGQQTGDRRDLSLDFTAQPEPPCEKP